MGNYTLKLRRDWEQWGKSKDTKRYTMRGSLYYVRNMPIRQYKALQDITNEMIVSKITDKYIYYQQPEQREIKPWQI